MEKNKSLQNIYVGVKQNDENRRENDLYETPPLATYLLHKYGNLPKNIVEPCAGRGNISIELARHGYNVVSYDLNDHENKVYPVQSGYDVMTLPKQIGFDAFVTNPPYFKDLPRKIAEKGVSEYDYTAVFVRLTFLEGQKRKKLFTDNPPSDIIFLSDRVSFKPNLKTEPVESIDQIGGMIAYCWIIWNKKAEHENTKLKWCLLKDEYHEWRKIYENSTSLLHA